MARPAWVQIPDSDVNLDSPQKTGLMTKLRDDAAAARIALIGLELEEASTTSTTFVEHADPLCLPHIPDVADYTGIQRKLYLPVQAKTAGGATGTYRLKDQATGTTGPEQTTTSGAYVKLTLELDVPAAQKGTDRIILVEYKSSSGANAAFVKTVPRVDGRLEY